MPPDQSPWKHEFSLSILHHFITGITGDVIIDVDLNSIIIIIFDDSVVVTR